MDWCIDVLLGDRIYMLVEVYWLMHGRVGWCVGSTCWLTFTIELAYQLMCWLCVELTCWLMLTLTCIKGVCGDPSTIFLVTIFTQKMPESSGFMYSSILMLENHPHYLILIIFPEVDQIHKKLWIWSNLIRVPGTHNWNKIHNFLWVQSTSGKMMMSYIF